MEVRIPAATNVRHRQSLSKLVLQTLLPRQTAASQSVNQSRKEPGSSHL